MNSEKYSELLAQYEKSTERKLIPASTVILMRDSQDQLEVLMVRRSPELKFVGGSWVFPGGKVDEEDYGPEKDIMAAGITAAVREVEEEVGLKIDGGSLIRISHWVPPPMLPKLFATWFFVAEAPMGEIEVDGSEICDYEWMAPASAIQKRDDGDIEIAPPTFMTLNELIQYSSTSEALENTARKPDLPFYATRIVSTPESTIALWEGDAGYESLDPAAEGSRHRLELNKKIWQLENTL